MSQGPITLPRSAAMGRPGEARNAPDDTAYLKNPTAGKDYLTPGEVVDAISMLSSILVADTRYREVLEARRAPDGR